MEGDGDDVCPVCLEDANATSVRVPCCRKHYCRPCLVALVDVKKGNTSHVLTCPTCRAEHAIPGGDAARWARKLALEQDDSTWGGATTALMESENTEQYDSSACSALSAEELLVIVAALRRGAGPQSAAMDDPLAKQLLLQELAVACNKLDGAHMLVSELPVKALRAVLFLREIPMDDCLERGDLVTRVLQSHFGRCGKLPARVLKRMLADEGLGHEIYVEKDALARRVAAARALRRPLPRLPGAPEVHLESPRVEVTSSERRTPFLAGRTVPSPAEARPRFVRADEGDAGLRGFQTARSSTRSSQEARRPRGQRTSLSESAPCCIVC